MKKNKKVKDVLKEYPLEVIITDNASKKFEKALTAAASQFNFLFRREKLNTYNQFCKYTITCYTNDFAKIYYYIGYLYSRQIHTQKKKTPRIYR